MGVIPRRLVGDSIIKIKIHSSCEIEDFVEKYDMSLPRLALKHTAVPLFSGEKSEFTAWTRDARYYAKGVGFLSAFVSDPPQYIPVGELDTKTSVLVDRGYSREGVNIHALA